MSKYSSNPNKHFLISCIGELIYQTTSKKDNENKRQTAFDSRVKSFIGEYYSTAMLPRNISSILLSGGWIIPLKSGKRFHQEGDVLYMTILASEELEKNKNEYLGLYKRLEGFKYKFFVVYEKDLRFNNIATDPRFSNINLPEPQIRIYFFNHEGFLEDSTIENIRQLSPRLYSKNNPSDKEVNFSFLKYLDCTSEEYLKNLYVNRYVFDYLIGNLFMKRGIPADFDLITFLGGTYNILEVKQKFPSKNEGFGMDMERIKDYQMHMRQYPCFKFYYVVMEVQRKGNVCAPLGWYYLPFTKFKQCCDAAGLKKLGGTGMLPENAPDVSRETLECNKSNFKKLPPVV